MRKLTVTYSALAAAIALTFGAVNAQESEQLSEAERAEIERQTEQLRDRTEQLDRQTEALEESTERLADERELSERRDELVAMAETSLQELQAQNPTAAELYEQAHGYAVFDTTKGGFIVTGAGGTGVAMEKDGASRTFMYLGQAGIGLGAGLESYRLVLLLEDAATYEQFVSGQWDGSISAQAAAGNEGVAAEEQFIDGIRAFRLTDAGLMAQVDVSGLRIWPSDELNEGDVQVAEIERGDRRATEAADDFGDAVDDVGDAVDEAADDVEQAVEETEDRLN